jgi:hypothetical protein
MSCGKRGIRSVVLPGNEEISVGSYSRDADGTEVAVGLLGRCLREYAHTMFTHAPTLAEQDKTNTREITVA